MYRIRLSCIAAILLANGCYDAAEQPERCSTTPGLSTNARAILQEQGISEERALMACVATNGLFDDEAAVEEVLKYRNKDAGIVGDPSLCDIIDQAAAAPTFRDKFVPVLQDLLSEVGQALQIPVQENDTYVVVKAGEVADLMHGYKRVHQAETNVLFAECQENTSGMDDSGKLIEHMARALCAPTVPQNTQTGWVMEDLCAAQAAYEVYKLAEQKGIATTFLLERNFAQYDFEGQVDWYGNGLLLSEFNPQISGLATISAVTQEGSFAAARGWLRQQTDLEEMIEELQERFPEASLHPDILAKKDAYILQQEDQADLTDEEQFDLEYSYRYCHRQGRLLANDACFARSWEYAH